MPQHDEAVNKLPAVGHNSEIAHVRESKRSAYHALAFQWIAKAEADQRIEGRHRTVLVMLGYHVDPDAWGCWLGYSGLVSLTGYSRSTIERVLRDLVSWGYVRRRKMVVEAASSDDPLTVYYFPRITVAELEEAIASYRERNEVRGAAMRQIRNAHVPQKTEGRRSKTEGTRSEKTEGTRSARPERPRSDRIYYKDDSLYINPEGCRADARAPVDWKAELNADNATAQQNCWWTKNLQIEVSPEFRSELAKTFPLVDVDAALRIVAGENVDKQGKALCSGLGLVAAINRRFGYLQNDAHTRKANYDRSAGSKAPNTSNLTRRQILERKARGML